MKVKRNPNRFPEDFLFQLSDSEIDLMVSQNAIPFKKSIGGAMPHTFAEPGVATFSGVLKCN